MDVYEPGPGAQIHDLNPSTFPPTGLFWTIEIPEDAIRVRLGKGRASLEVDDVHIFDYGSLQNAVFGGGPAPIPGSVSFLVNWSGVNERLAIRNEAEGFVGEYIRNTAQMEWTATVGDLQFVSAPLSTSSSTFAEIGHESNGSFFS